MAVVTEAVRTSRRAEVIDVTDRVRRLVTSAGVRSGMVVVYVPHTTAAVTINENADPDVRHDMLAKLEALVPKHETYYRHGCIFVVVAFPEAGVSSWEPVTAVAEAVPSFTDKLP